MVKIKICGIKRLEDIEIVNRYKPDYIGFVFADSKRKVSHDLARKLKDNLDSDIISVGVFVDAPENEILELFGDGIIEVAQLHGDEDELYGDSGYLNVEEHISENKQKESREYNINRRRGAKKKLEPNDQVIFEIEEFAKSTVRSKVEHVFGVVKRLFRFRRTRYRGLRKQQAKLNMIFALANLYPADKKGLLV